MDSMKIKKQFVKDNPDMTLKEAFKEVFEKNFQIGSWNAEETDLGAGKRLFFIEKEKQGTCKGYGFNGFGEWIGHSWYCSEGFEPATHQEVETALIEEAKRRGFKEGVYVNPANKTWSRKLKLHLCKNEREFIFRDNGLLCCGVEILHNGKWAEIIPTLTKQIRQRDS